MISTNHDFYDFFFYIYRSTNKLQNTLRNFPRTNSYYIVKYLYICIINDLGFTIKEIFFFIIRILLIKILRIEYIED